MEAITPEQDGLGAWRYRLPAGARISGPDPRSGAGQHWLVVGGELIGADQSVLRPFSLIFVAPDEGPFEALAGADGLEILCMQYPDRGTIRGAASPT